ncbi:MAG TPA: tetratricopeptide repeat protein [Ignavibacteria bacterium]|nr:tetratricopeptide repeat protein [Ignavibacteria bacterium]HRJ04409.1 tetratricopeptide repeat protein [Ignavibacteria bacterium]
MKNPIITKIPVFLLLLAISACSTFNYKTYKEEPNKDIDDPDPNYDITLTSDFQDFTGFMFIGNRIENFSTYFNTFFNANENFNEAYDDYSTRVLANYNERQDSIFARPRLSQESIDKFNIAIEKASKVIQYHKSSEYMDRSVLLIGKSYFFLGDYLKAERKFSEFISKLKSSRYLDEALLYLAKTQIRLENEKPALERLNALIKSSEEKNVVSESYQSLAEYYLNRKDYENAIKNFRSAIEFSNDSEFKAQMQFLVASVIARSNPKLASKEFDKVLDYNASYDLEYLARFNTAKNMVASGNFSGAVDIIEDLEIKYKDISANLGQVNFLRGVYYDEKKDNKSSINQFYSVIQNFPATIPSADASYKLGKYFESRNEYLNAYMYFKYSTEQSNAGTFYKESLAKSNIYKRYFELRSTITGETINTDYNEEFRKKTTKDYDKNTDPNKLPNKEGDNGKSGGNSRFELADSILTGEDSTFTIVDTSRAKERQISAAKFELAELFLYDLNRADSCEFYLKEAYSESLDYDFSAKVLFALSALYRKQEDIAKSEEVLNTIIKDYPLSSVANSSRKLLNLSIVDQAGEDIADSLYNEAESKFVRQDYRAALDDFTILISSYPSSIHMEKAYLGAGWIYENIVNNNDSAYYYYSMLVKEKPNSEAASIVMQKVGEYEEFNKVNNTDTSGVNSQTPETGDPNTKQPEELKKQTDPEVNPEGTENNNIDPMQLLKELEENNKDRSGEESNNPENTEENPAPFDPGKQEPVQQEP